MIDLQQLDDIKSNIDEQIINISKTFKELSYLVKELNTTSKEYNRECMKRNPYIVKRVIKHIANGMSKQDAILLTADELGENTSRVKVLFSHQKAYMSALHLFARKYAAEQMKKAGFKTKTVAKTLGISENHVYKLVKSVPNEWILDNF